MDPQRLLLSLAPTFVELVRDPSLNQEHHPRLVEVAGAQVSKQSVKGLSQSSKFAGTVMARAK
jgi:hypothetical protein